MTISCQNQIQNSSKNWALLLNFIEISWKQALGHTYANLYAYAANNPVRYKDPDGRENDDIVTWTATEVLVLDGMDMRFCYSGMTMQHGYADVEFSNGKESFTKRFEVVSIYSEGLFLSIGESSLSTVYTKQFNEDVTKEDIIQSYEGIFATQGVSISFPKLPYSISYGETFGVDERTRDVAENGWKGMTSGTAIGLGTGIDLPKKFSLNIGTQITVYRDPDNPAHEFSKKPEWFYYKPFPSK